MPLHYCHDAMLRYALATPLFRYADAAFRHIFSLAYAIDADADIIYDDVFAAMMPLLFSLLLLFDVFAIRH